MKKHLLTGLFVFTAYTVFCQQHILDMGLPQPCYSSRMQHIKTDLESVTMLLKDQSPVPAHVKGKVVSVFEVGGLQQVIIQTTDNYYVCFGNLEKSLVKKGDDIQQGQILGYPAINPKTGKYELYISYDTPNATVPCRQVLELLMLSKEG